MTHGFMIVDRVGDMSRLLNRFPYPQRLGCRQNGILDRGIARAATQCVFERKANIGALWIRVALEQGISRQDLSRDAEAALNSPMFHEGFLQGMQFHLFMDALSESFDRDN